MKRESVQAQEKAVPVEIVDAMKHGPDHKHDPQDDSHASTKSMDEAEAAEEAPVKIQLLEAVSGRE